MRPHGPWLEWPPIFTHIPWVKLIFVFFLFSFEGGGRVSYNGRLFFKFWHKSILKLDVFLNTANDICKILYNNDPCYASTASRTLRLLAMKKHHRQQIPL